jgi:hypothetical protein
MARTRRNKSKRRKKMGGESDGHIDPIDPIGPIDAALNTDQEQTNTDDDPPGDVLPTESCEKSCEKKCKGDASPDENKDLLSKFKNLLNWGKGGSRKKQRTRKRKQRTRKRKQRKQRKQRTRRRRKNSK